jgi:DNA-directed RNA polymerase specialized sigma24 family protein
MACSAPFNDGQPKLVSRQPGQSSPLLHVEEIKSVLRSVRRRLSVPGAAADDFDQDAWLYLLTKDQQIASGFQGRSTPKTYYYRILLNYGRTWTRRRQRFRNGHLPLDGGSESALALRGPKLTTDAALRTVEIREAVRFALSALSVEERRTLWDWAVGPDLAIPRNKRNSLYCRTWRALHRARAICTGVQTRDGYRSR